MAYEIQNADSGEILASNLSDEQLAAWWAKNEDAYFGLRVVGNVIKVVAI
jgi:hypothetical protein